VDYPLKFRFFINFSEYRIWYRQTTKIKIWFSPEAAEYKKEKKWHESQDILEQKDDSIIFKSFILKASHTG